MEERFFTLSEVTKYLKIPKSTIYKLSQKGKIPSVKIGKQLRFRKSSLDKWLTEKEGGPKVPAQESLLIPDSAKTVEQNPKQVLLIDDDELVLKTLANFLKIYGYNVELAKDGEEALKKAEELTFDLIIADVRMPGIDGIETIKRIRETLQRKNRPAVPEIIITGYMDTHAQQEAEKLGIADYIYKPFATVDFMRTVEEKFA